MKNFLSLKTILIPTIIPVVYKLGLYFCFIICAYQIVSNFESFGLQYFISLPFILFYFLVLIPLILRIVCEVLIILARINDSLADIKEKLNTQQEDVNTESN